MQLFSYNPHPFLFIAFPSFFCLIKCFIYFSQHVLQLSQHGYFLFAMIYHSDVVGLAFLGQDMSKFHICTLIYMLVFRSSSYAQLYMSMCSLPCLCLDLHVSVQIYVPMLRSCVYMLCAMLVCSDLCWLLCHVLLQTFVS